MSVIVDYWDKILAGIVAIGGYFIGVKKDKADIFTTMQTSYKVFIDDMNLKYTLMSGEVKGMQSRIDTFEKSERKLKDLVSNLQTKIVVLEKENKQLRERLIKQENK